jgi:hypothetical protein
MGDHGIADEEARRLFHQWSGEDRYFPLEVEMRAVGDAGFADVECFWRRGLCSVICGLRAP